MTLLFRSGDSSVNGTPKPGSTGRGCTGSRPDRAPVAAARPRDASLPGGTLCRHSPEVGAQYGSPARWDLRRGPPARAVPTATRPAGDRRHLPQAHLLDDARPAQPAPTRGAARPVPGAQGHQRTPGERSERVFDSQKNRRNYTNPLGGSLHGLRGTPGTFRSPAGRSGRATRPRA